MRKGFNRVQRDLNCVRMDSNLRWGSIPLQGDYILVYGIVAILHGIGVPSECQCTSKVVLELVLLLN